MFNTVQGYGPDVAKNRAEAQALMKKAGYGPDNRLKLKVSTRNHLLYRDPAVILIDQLKHIWIDGELEIIDTTIYYNRVFKKDYVVALNLTGSAVDDPDVTLFEGYACGSLRNYNNYCNNYYNNYYCNNYYYNYYPQGIGQAHTAHDRANIRA